MKPSSSAPRRQRRKAAVRDGRLNSSELPLAPQAPSSTPSETSPASSTPNDDSASSPGSVQTVGSSQDNTASTGHCSTPGGQSQGVVEWRLVPPSPGGGVLGSGETGYVHAGRFNGIPAAVKLGAVGSWEEEALAHEASMYKALHHLQDIHIPAMLYHGPAAGRVVLMTKRVFGRPLRGGGQDAHLLQLALAPLRAVHAAGFLHGDVSDVRNFMVEGEQDAAGTQAQVEDAQPTRLRVMLLDFGNAIPCTSREDQLDEEEELITALCGESPVPEASPPPLHGPESLPIVGPHTDVMTQALQPRAAQHSRTGVRHTTPEKRGKGSSTGSSTGKRRGRPPGSGKRKLDTQSSLQHLSSNMRASMPRTFRMPEQLPRPALYGKQLSFSRALIRL